MTERLSKVFMLNEELSNCQFIPKISKPPKSANMKAAGEEEDKLPEPNEKYGENFKKSDPMIYK